MATFEETLRALLIAEFKRTLDDPESAADMLTEMLRAHASLLAMAGRGDPEITAGMTALTVDLLPGAVEQKAASLRGRPNSALVH